MVLLMIWTIALLLKIVSTNKYIINTSGCKIQDFDMSFDDRPKRFVSCGDRHVFVEKIAVNKIRFVFIKDLKDCCYSYKSRSNLRNLEERVFNYSPCVVMKNMTVTDLKGDMIVIQCDKTGSYADYVPIVKKNLKTEKADKDSYNVLLLGIDTMSRKRAYNSMRETVEILKNDDWFDFRGYTKIDANTIPNFTALLTGKLMRDGPTSFIYTCYVNTSACNDLYLWSKFKNKGYVTAFVEDTASGIATIIREVLEVSPLQPTDHYIGPIFKTSHRNNITYCAGALSCGEHVLNYALDFANTYKDNNFFGAFWIGTQTHDTWNSPPTFDVFVAKFLRDLKTTGVFDNTFVIFLGDHGIRFGIARYQIECYLEERLPMFFMHVPPKFRKNHLQKYVNLKLNEKRLTSTFDLHLTMKNILSLKEEQNGTDGCKTCLSLFHRIPENRRCADAGIKDQWCACFTLKETSVKEEGARISAKKAAMFVEELPKNLPTKPNTHCQEYFLIKILRIHSFNSNSATKYYIIGFVVNPSVVYEVIVRRYAERNEFRYDVLHDQTISEFGDRGDCINYGSHPLAYTCVCVYNIDHKNKSKIKIK